MDIREVLIRILKEKGANVDQLSEETSLKELGLDSLDTVEVMMAIEEELSIEFSTDELADAKTIQDVLNLIEKKVK